MVQHRSNIEKQYPPIPQEYRVILLLNEPEDYWQLIESLTERLKHNPNDAMALNNRGLAYSEIGKKDEALKDFNESIRISPVHTEPYLNIAELWSRYGDGHIDAAIEACTKALNVDNKDVTIYRTRAYLHAQRRNYEDAVKDFDKAIAIDPKFKKTFTDRNAFAKIGELKSKTPPSAVMFYILLITGLMMIFVNVLFNFLSQNNDFYLIYFGLLIIVISIQIAKGSIFD